MSHFRLPLTLVALFAVLAFASQAAAQASWAIAERNDEQIISFIGKLEGYVDTVPGQKDAGAVILYRHVTADVEQDNSRLCLNFIVEVRDPSSLPDRLLAPYGPNEEPTTREGFVLRDGNVTRLEGTFEEGREDIGRGRTRYEWGELKKGDIIGYSLVHENEGPIFALNIPLAEEFPMVISGVTMYGNERYTYKPLWVGIEPKDLSIKEQELVDGRPTVLKVSANQCAAVSDMPAMAPYPERIPHAIVVLNEAFVEPQSAAVRAGWMRTAGWNQAAMQMAGLLKQQTDEAKGLDIMLSAITTGKTTAQDKAAAITAYVRDKIALLDGPDVDPEARREVSAVIKSKEATEMEKVVLAAVMMKKAGVPVTIAGFRGLEYGPLDEVNGHWVMMTDAALRVEAEGQTVYYAPQCATCEPGQLPAEWAGQRALVYDADITEKGEEMQTELQKKAMASGDIDLVALQDQFESKDWARFEELTSR